MTRGARVTSIETVQDFRNKLCEFGKDAKDVLCAAEMHIRRMFDWLNERGKHWQREIKLRQEEVVRAKIELESRKAMCKDGRGPGTSDQERALHKAKMRLKEAEDKLSSCKRWVPQLQHAVHEYHGPARALAGRLDTDLVQSLALLQRKLEDLERYLALAPPSTPLPAGVGGPAEEQLATAGSPNTTVATPPPETATPPEVTPTQDENKTEAVQPGEERIATCT
jgi:DNA repair exonuclease SbcCD ATPase subunit